MVGVMSNVTAALMCVAGSLRHLTFETQGCLVVSQWAAALTKLESACFIGGDVHLKQASRSLEVDTVLAGVGGACCDAAKCMRREVAGCCQVGTCQVCAACQAQQLQVAGRALGGMPCWGLGFARVWHAAVQPFLSCRALMCSCFALMQGLGKLPRLTDLEFGSNVAGA